MALAHDLIDQEGCPIIVSAYDDWKDRFCQHWDGEAAVPGARPPGDMPPSPWGQPLVVWRAFTGFEGEPLDVRIRWFAGEGDAERLHAEVATHLRSLGRAPNLPYTSGPGQDRGAVFVQVLFDDSWRPRVSHGPWGAPETVPHLPPGALATLALAQLTGEPPEDFTPTATYLAEVCADGAVSCRLEVLDPSLTADGVRAEFAAKLGRAINFDKLGSVRTLFVERDRDGVITWGVRCTVQERFVPEPQPAIGATELLARALRDLSD